MSYTILLVDDDDVLTSSLSVRLTKEGYLVDTAGNAGEGFEKATSLPFDLIILDIILPDESGLELCRDIRKAGVATPILILSARHDTSDKVAALKLGADDYVSKPFNASEVVARIAALLRRLRGRYGRGVHQIGSVRVDIARARVTRNGESIHLSAREFQLLCYLLERPGSSIPRTELLQSIWGYDSGDLTRTVDVHIASLRNKLEEHPNSPEMIITAPGIGYKFVPPQSLLG